MTRPRLRLAVLGGPATFGGQAARRMQALYPEFSELVYFPADGAAPAGDDDARCAPEQMSRGGSIARMQQQICEPGSITYVRAEITHEHHASLLAKPGARLETVRRVLGHAGSLIQSHPWLTAHIPQAELVTVETSSQAAAEEVAKSDGTIASVGTSEMAHQYGLVELGKDIDGGNVGNYWTISAKPLFSDTPTRLVVTGRFDGGGRLGALITTLAAAGFRLLTLYSQPTGRALFEYDYVLRFGGSGTLAEVQRALTAFSSARLAGAFEAREG